MTSNKKYRKTIIEILKRPIQIFGLLLLVMETLFIFLLHKYEAHQFSGLFVFAIIIMPILFGFLLFRLFTKYPHVNLSPASFIDQKDFLELFRMSSQKIENWQKQTNESISKPFSYSDDVSLTAPNELNVYANRIEKILSEFNSHQLFNLHTWFNANNKHKLALMCIDLAIASGDVESKYFSFRSGSLRKLGRNIEALHSAKLAKQLDTNNIDSYYNIARALSILDRKEEAKEYVEYIINSGNEKYVENISKYFDIN